MCALHEASPGIPGVSVISAPCGEGMVLFGSDQVDALKGTTTP
jgi:hypothetical protein